MMRPRWLWNVIRQSRPRFFLAFVIPLKQAWGNALTQKSQRCALAFHLCGETGIRTLATVARRQISNLLHYHSGTSPNPAGSITRLRL